MWMLIAIIIVFPIYWTFVISTRTRLEIFTETSLIPKGFYSLNYIRPLFHDIYGSFLLNSLIIATSNTVLVIFLALLATYALSRFKVKGAANIFFWTLTNRMAPPAAFLLPLYLLYTKLITIHKIPILFDSYPGMILAYCVFNLPFAIWLLKGTIDSIPKDLDEAAMVDGASITQILVRIVIPLAAPGIAVVALLNWLFAWNEYLFAATLTSMKARTITTGLAEFVTIVGTNWGEMAAMSVIAILPALVFLIFVQKYIITGLTFGAVKE
ncbi:MAG: carbohydrate ABC transporter permease [Thermotogae bacterium]|nr:carbohydrate ABC transporter permease [Thermotogota bacterium]